MQFNSYISAQYGSYGGTYGTYSGGYDTPSGGRYNPISTQLPACDRPEHDNCGADNAACNGPLAANYRYHCQRLCGLCCPDAADDHINCAPWPLSYCTAPEWTATFQYWCKAKCTDCGGR